MTIPDITHSLGHCVKIACAVALVAAATACSSEKQPEIPTLDIATNIGCADKGSLNDIFDFGGMIRPELTDSTLLSYANVRGVRGTTIYMQENNRLMTFNMKDGRCLSSFDHTGTGEEDYNMLGLAFPAPENGDWVAYDTSNKKIVRYRADGKFVGAYEASLGAICPDGDKWVGQKSVPEEYNQVIYVYDDNFLTIDTIQTHLPRYYMPPSILDTFNGRPVMKAQDTLFMVTPDNRFVPEIAFSLANYSMPYYKEDEFEKMMAERWHYLKFDFNGLGKLAGISYQFSGTVTLQFYSLTDCTLLYSANVFPAHFTGFPYIVNGTKYNIVPMGQPTDDMVFATISASQLENPEDNPAILILKPKAKFL